jgi:hypothetical protein
MERFDFVICRDESFLMEGYYGTRETADLHFDHLCKQRHTATCAYYATETGGLVNAYHRD